MSLTVVDFFTLPEEEWRAYAACAGQQPDLWYSENPTDVAIAKRYCDRCPVQPDCLAHALAHGEDYGIWGGLSERARKRMRRRAGIRTQATPPPDVMTGMNPSIAEHDRTGRSANETAAALGISRRTVQRDRARRKATP